MRAKLFIAGVLATILIMGFGCSDSSTTRWIEGSETDFDYMLVQPQINNVIDSAIASFNSAFDSYNLLPTDEGDDDVIIATYAPGGGDVNYTYNYYASTGWHEIWVAQETDYYAMYTRDSVQFRQDGDFVEQSSGADYMDYIHNWIFETDNGLTDETYANWTGRTQLVFTDLDQNFCELNGSGNAVINWNYISEDTTIAAEFESNVTYNDIVFGQVPSYGWVSGCPVSGQMNINFSQSYTITVDDTPSEFSHTWTISVTFDSGSASVHITRNNYTWNYTRDLCTVIN
jgi:hypothetical protein